MWRLHVKDIESGLEVSQKTYRERATETQIPKKCEQYLSRKKDRDM